MSGPWGRRAPYTPREPYMNGPGQPSRAGPSSRREGDDDSGRERDHRSYPPSGYGRPTEALDPRNQASSSWSRPSPRINNYRPSSRSRSHTLSPPRRGFDRERDRDWGSEREGAFDYRDGPKNEPGRRGPVGTGDPGQDQPHGRRVYPVGTSPGRERPLERAGWDRGDGRWNERRDDRFRDDPQREPSGLYRPSPPDSHPPRSSVDRPRSPLAAPTGPRSLAARTPPSFTPPSRLPSGPRSVSGPSAYNHDGRGRNRFPSRDITRSFNYPENGAGPSRLPPVPRAPRSMRGSSSPVEVRRVRPDDTTTTPATVPTATSTLPTGVKMEPHVGDLEEGEVLSPVKRSPHILWSHEDDRPRLRDRWSSPGRDGAPPNRNWRRERHSMSPHKRSQTRTSPLLRRNEDEGWSSAERRRSLVPQAERRNSSPIFNRLHRSPPQSENEVIDEKYKSGPVAKLDRPLTPSHPPPSEYAYPALSIEVFPPSGVTEVHPSRVSRPDTPSFPPPLDENPNHIHSLPVLSPTIPFRPDTPAFPPPEEKLSPPGMPSRRGQNSISVSDLDRPPVSEPPAEKSNCLVAVSRSNTRNVIPVHPLDRETPQRADMMATQPSQPGGIAVSARYTDPMQRVSRATFTSASDSALIPANGTRGQSVDMEVLIDADPPNLAEVNNSIGTRSIGLECTPMSLESANVEPLDENATPTHAPGSPALPVSIRRVTIAERRSVILPPTDTSLSSPFGEKHPRRDPMPTMDSVQTSTDAETEGGPRTGDLDDMRSEASAGARESTKLDHLSVAVKVGQRVTSSLDIDAILAWNRGAAPARSSRIPQRTSPGQRDKRLREITWPLNKQQQLVASHVVAAIKRETLATERKIKDIREEYRELDEEWKEHCSLLDRLMEKRGPPPADLYATNAAIPVITPGPIPVTPSEDIIGSRANRRRAVGDAVTTEAEFQEILAGLADTAARDPNFRASKTTAVVPDMVVGEETKLQYDDDNDLVTDPLAFYDFAGTSEPIWTEEERATFMRRYMAYPKQFGRIADGLPSKSASDCVLYYYRTKRAVDYKGMLASRRGDKKKKTIQIKKTGKSSALLANLDRQIPTINPSMPLGPKSAITPARASRDDAFGSTSSARRVRMLPGTPGVDAAPGRRRKAEEEDRDSSGAPSRDGSEAPMASKAKMRMTIKAPKRPRISSVSGSDGALTSTGVLPDFASVQYRVNNDGENGTELLPPVKRAGKRRKVTDLSDPTVDLPTAEKPVRRTATNSYWSVEEKRKFRDLVGLHGTNAKAIATELGGKSERQVANFFDAHREDMRLDEVMRAGGVEGTSGRIGNDSDMMASYPKHALQARSIYDVYPSQPPGFDHRYSEPRLGMFPTNGPPLLVSDSGSTRPPSQPLVKPISRTGGMRISALLNDDGDDSSAARTGPRGLDSIDTASDGTVSERDVEGGVARPSPRSAASVPAPAWQGDSYERRPSAGTFDRPDLDRFRSNSAKTYYEIQPPAWPSRAGYYPPRAATATPALPHHRPAWETPHNPSMLHPSLTGFPSRPNDLHRVSSDRDGLPPPPRAAYQPHPDPRFDRQPSWRGYPASNTTSFGSLPPLQSVPPPQQAHHLERSPLVPREALPSADP